MKVIYTNGDEDRMNPWAFVEVVIPNDGRRLEKIVLWHGKECRARTIRCDTLPADFNSVYFKCPDMQWIAHARTHRKEHYEYEYQLGLWIKEK